MPLTTLALRWPLGPETCSPPNHPEVGSALPWRSLCSRSKASLKASWSFQLLKQIANSRFIRQSTLSWDCKRYTFPKGKGK